MLLKSSDMIFLLVSGCLHENINKLWFFVIFNLINENKTEKKAYRDSVDFCKALNFRYHMRIELLPS